MKIENFKLKANSGFTLVELLIVLALIGVLAAALVATLDPIEQVNKARDARYKNDAAEMLGAFERYYASIQQYPWMGWDETSTITTNTEIGLFSTMNGFGVCGDVSNRQSGSGKSSTDDATVCNSTGEDVGVLVDSHEIKGSFANKDQFDGVLTDGDKTEGLFSYYDGTGNIYVCFIPKSKTYRQDTSKLSCLDTDASGSPQNYSSVGETVGSDTCAAPSSAGGTEWDTATSSGASAIFVCVPE